MECVAAVAVLAMLAMALGCGFVAGYAAGRKHLLKSFWRKNKNP